MKYDLKAYHQHLMTIFHDCYSLIKKGKVDFESAVKISSGFKPNEKFIRIIPSGEYATLISKGNYLESIKHYNKLLNHIKFNAYTIDGPTIRKFLFSYAYSKSEDNVIAEFQIKIKR